MKKLLLLFLLLSLSCAAAVPDVLMGIKTGSPYAAAVRTAMQKGWKLHETTKLGTVFILQAFGRESALFIQNHEGTVSVVSINVSANAMNYIEGFNLIYNGLVSKYGSPADEIREFRYPYTAGDGYTTTGIRLGKVDIRSTWKLGDYMAIVQIRSDLNIFMLYAHVPTYQKWQKRYNDSQTQGL
jgi:hypothetical protein